MKIIIISLFIILNITLGQSVPMLINYQAKLVDDSNNPITGTVSVTFRLYDAIDGGNELWNETHSSIQSSNGIIGVLLGSMTTFASNVFNGPSLFLETEVSGYGILDPRQQLTSVPYAIKAENTLSLMYHYNGYLNPDTWGSGQDEIVFDTTFVLDKKEFLKIETNLNNNYYDPSSAELFFGLVGSETSYGSITGNDSPHSSSSSSHGYNPQIWWNIPIESDMIGSNVRLYVKTCNSNTCVGYLSKLFIWGK